MSKIPTQATYTAQVQNIYIVGDRVRFVPREYSTEIFVGTIQKIRRTFFGRFLYFVEYRWGGDIHGAWFPRTKIIRLEPPKEASE